ncbi:MAG TPA: heme-binding domain-containing protein, partial [Candidatus Polarisedimenticolia bacterium]|nr:heme-binding domain-containing protein [Candidatus Polarisedimenticolia bacterium]
VPTTVAGIVGRACNDCHSNRTVWPWYSEIAPVSWFVVHHVNEGRRELNFSEWSVYDAKRVGKLRKEICDEVSEGEMPGFVYTLMHREAKLTNADIEEVCRWTQSRSRVVTAGPG